MIDFRLLLNSNLIWTRAVQMTKSSMVVVSRLTSPPLVGAEAAVGWAGLEDLPLREDMAVVEWAADSPVVGSLEAVMAEEVSRASARMRR